MQFIIDQLEDRLNKKEAEVSRHNEEVEALKVQIVTLNDQKLEASSFCKALYEQSIIYYNNFKAMEDEFTKTC